MNNNLEKLSYFCGILKIKDYEECESLQKKLLKQKYYEEKRMEFCNRSRMCGGGTCGHRSMREAVPVLEHASLYLDGSGSLHRRLVLQEMV